MSSKRYKNLPEKTRDLQSETLDKLIPILKKIVQLSSMSLRSKFTN